MQVKSFNGLLIIFFLTLISCEPPIKGSGEIQSRALQLEKFNAIISDVEGVIIVNASANNTNECKIEAQQNILPLITTKIVNEELLISLKQGVHIASYENVNIQINTNSLSSVKLLGGGTTIINDSITIARNMLCSMMGSGNLELHNGNYSNLSLQNSGIGTIKANNCTAKSADFGLKGDGSILASTTKVGSLKCIINGNGLVKAMVSDSIYAETKDAGTMHYGGNPRYVKLKTGKVGTIENMP
jgi:hypothetical protein